MSSAILDPSPLPHAPPPRPAGVQISSRSNVTQFLSQIVTGTSAARLQSAMAAQLLTILPSDYRLGHRTTDSPETVPWSGGHSKCQIASRIRSGYGTATCSPWVTRSSHSASMFGCAVAWRVGPCALWSNIAFPPALQEVHNGVCRRGRGHRDWAMRARRVGASLATLVTDGRMSSGHELGGVAHPPWVYNHG